MDPAAWKILSNPQWFTIREMVTTSFRLEQTWQGATEFSSQTRRKVYYFQKHFGVDFATLHYGNSSQTTTNVVRRKMLDRRSRTWLLHFGKVIRGIGCNGFVKRRVKTQYWKYLLPTSLECSACIHFLILWGYFYYIVSCIIELFLSVIVNFSSLV